MKEIKLRKIYRTVLNDSTVAYWHDLEIVADKVNEIVRYLNAHRTLADMSPEEIEKIGKFIQELDEREWKIPPYKDNSKRKK